METKRAAAKERNLHLRLYIADGTTRSLNARANLKRICEEHIKGKYHVETVDIVKSPEAAIRDQDCGGPNPSAESSENQRPIQEDRWRSLEYL